MHPQFSGRLFRLQPDYRTSHLESYHALLRLYISSNTWVLEFSHSPSGEVVGIFTPLNEHQHIRFYNESLGICCGDLLFAFHDVQAFQYVVNTIKRMNDTGTGYSWHNSHTEALQPIRRNDSIDHQHAVLTEHIGHNGTIPFHELSHPNSTLYPSTIPLHSAHSLGDLKSHDDWENDFSLNNSGILQDEVEEPPIEFMGDISPDAHHSSNIDDISSNDQHGIATNDCIERHHTPSMPNLHQISIPSENGPDHVNINNQTVPIFAETSAEISFRPPMTSMTHETISPRYQNTSMPNQIRPTRLMSHTTTMPNVYHPHSTMALSHNGNTTTSIYTGNSHSMERFHTSQPSYINYSTPLLESHNVQHPSNHHNSCDIPLIHQNGHMKDMDGTDIAWPIRQRAHSEIVYSGVRHSIDPNRNLSVKVPISSETRTRRSMSNVYEGHPLDTMTTTPQSIPDSNLSFSHKRVRHLSHNSDIETESSCPSPKTRLIECGNAFQRLRTSSATTDGGSSPSLLRTSSSPSKRGNDVSSPSAASLAVGNLYKGRSGMQSARGIKRNPEVVGDVQTATAPHMQRFIVRSITCHSCHYNRELLINCPVTMEQGGRHAFCANCLRRRCNVDFHAVRTGLIQWHCPVCAKACPCASCKRANQGVRPYPFEYLDDRIDLHTISTQSGGYASTPCIIDFTGVGPTQKPSVYVPDTLVGQSTATTDSGNNSNKIQSSSNTRTRSVSVEVSGTKATTQLKTRTVRALTECIPEHKQEIQSDSLQNYSQSRSLVRDAENPEIVAMAAPYKPARRRARKRRTGTLQSEEEHSNPASESLSGPQISHNSATNPRTVDTDVEFDSSTGYNIEPQNSVQNESLSALPLPLAISKRTLPDIIQSQYVAPQFSAAESDIHSIDQLPLNCIQAVKHHDFETSTTPKQKCSVCGHRGSLSRRLFTHPLVPCKLTGESVLICRKCWLNVATVRAKLHEQKRIHCAQMDLDRMKDIHESDRPDATTNGSTLITSKVRSDSCIPDSDSIKKTLRLYKELICAVCACHLNEHSTSMESVGQSCNSAHCPRSFCAKCFANIHADQIVNVDNSWICSICQAIEQYKTI